MRVPLKTFHDLPPYGFFVYVPETNWESPKYIGLESAIKEVQKHFLANNRFGWKTDEASVRDYILVRTEARLRSMPGGEAWLAPGPSESPPESFNLPRRQRSQRPGRQNAAELPAKPMAGVGTIISWLGDGLRPVDQATADHRASICARCELNVRMEGFEKAIGTVGDILHSIMEAKNHMKLATPHDNVLHQCSACLCVCSTKVWTPADHIKKGMTPEVEAKLATACWIRRLPEIST